MRESMNRSIEKTRKEAKSMTALTRARILSSDKAGNWWAL